jgi:diacylglycerol kinase family enzyme
MIANELLSKVGPFKLEVIQSAESISPRVSSLMRSGESVYIAAGGDGTVNLLLNAIMLANENPNDVVLGAIGLGSSNDFHKPFALREMVHNVPMRIKSETALASDVICVQYLDLNNQRSTQFCLNNASIGVTAEANALFNRRLGIIRGLRKLSVNGAIAATAMKTILVYRNLPCRLGVEHSDVDDCMITNLGIVKNPHFAGSLSYEPLVQPDDGQMGVCLCEEMSRSQAIFALARLARGKFQGYPNTRTWRATQVSVESKQWFTVELDGETIKTRAAEFSVKCKALRCCQ